MTTARESEILTRVGPGTPMGRLMREYWIPAEALLEFNAAIVGLIEVVASFP